MCTKIFLIGHATMIQYNLVKCKAAVNALTLHLTEKERLYFAARCEHEYDQ